MIKMTNISDVLRKPYGFNVPHSLALAEDLGLICVADRENSRVQCFNTQDASFAKSIQPQQMGRPYSVAYAPVNGELEELCVNSFCRIYSFIGGENCRMAFVIVKSFP